MKNTFSLITWLTIVVLFSLSSCTNTNQNSENNTVTKAENEQETANSPSSMTTSEETKQEEEIQKTAEPVTEIDLNSETAYDFPNFMKFDLKNWKKISEKKYEEGDGWGTVYRYEKSGQILEFNDGLSSYGYNQSFKLFDDKEKLLKERDFYYADGFMGENVVDYTVEPAQKYSRDQEKRVEYKLWESDDKPLTLSGDWKKSNHEPMKKE